MFDKVSKHFKIVSSAVPRLGTDGAFHYVYCVINMKNKKFYIGKHSTTNLADNYYGSGLLIKRAIYKHGIENFIKFELEFFDSSELAYIREKELLTITVVKDENCYNRITGGRGGLGCGGTNPIYALSEAGRNPITILTQQGKHPTTMAKLNGTLKTMGSNNTNYKKNPWDNVTATTESLASWSVADKVYDIWKDNQLFGWMKLSNLCSENFDTSLTEMPLRNMIHRFRGGWVPDQDQDWLKFKQEYDR